jgi:hypothetical protein
MNELYQKNSTTLVKDVFPVSDLKEMINIFMTDASINMGSDFSENTLERIIEIIQFSFKFLPIYYIAGAFKKGSLGDYGSGRLVPRTVYGWLNSITAEYNRDEDHKRNISDINIPHFSDLEKYPLGKAINKKSDWLKNGVITEEEWDRIPLKEVAEKIGQGLECVPEIWNIKSKQ